MAVPTMSNNYTSSTNYRNSCNFWTDECMKNVADYENDNFTPIINYSTSDSGWSTPTNGWATPTNGWATPTNGWATPLSGYGTPVGVGTPSCRRRILAENHKDEIYIGGSRPGQRNKDEIILSGKYFNKSRCRIYL
jgi:hypothetical protein